MGTSTSYRAPNRPKWNAFNAALSGGEGPRRVVSEMFNAGEEWEQALSSPSIAVFADAVAGLPGNVYSKLGEGQSREAVVRQIADDVTAASLDAGFSPALSMAQRSFFRIVLTLLNSMPETDDGIEEQGRETPELAPGVLSAQYLSELTSQFARHVIDRESGRLAILVESWTAEDQRQLTDRASIVAASIARAVAIESFAGSVPTASSWSAVVHRVFELGRQLPIGAASA